MMKWSDRTSAAKPAEQAAELLTAATAAVASQSTRMWWPDQRPPKVAMASASANSSRQAMG